MNQTSQQPSLKEKQSHGTRLFPCAYYHFCNPSHRLRVRHHWHEEVEIVYLHHGSFKLDINMEPYGTDRECFLSHNHHFKWWFVVDPIRVLCLHA